MLAPCAAKALQGVSGDVVTARHRDALDRIGHVGHRNLQRASSHVFSHRGPAGGFRDATGQLGKVSPHHVGIQSLVGARAEQGRKVRRLDPAQHHVGIGHCQRPAAPIGRWTGIGACRRGPDAQPRAIETDDGPPTRGHGVDAHHRRAHPNPCDLGVESALELARLAVSTHGVVRHIGRGAAHVETDQLTMTRRQPGAHHADDAARRTGQDRVLALKALSRGQSARALHHVERHAGHLRFDLGHVASQDRRQVGVDHGGVATRDQLDQRAHLV